MVAPSVLLAGILMIGIALGVWRAGAQTRRAAPEPTGHTFIKVGDDVQVVAGNLELRADGALAVLSHPSLHVERDERADMASLSLQDGQHVLVGPLEPATLELLDRTNPRLLYGVQGQFVCPPDTLVARERTVFLGSNDEALGAQILRAFAPSEEPAADAAIPWSLDGATRYAAKYLLDQRIALEATVTAPGDVEVRFPDGEEGFVHLGNLFLNEMHDNDPTEAQAALERFLRNVHPTGDAGLKRVQLLPRIHRGVPPIVLTGSLASGESVSHELAGHPIGDDLSVIYVQDLPDRMRYLGPDDAASVEPDPGARLALARGNLGQTLQRIRILGEGPVYMVVCGGNYEASLILLPELWEALDPLLDGPRMIAIPARDLLFVTGDASPERRLQMLTLARPETELAYPISDGVYRWYEGRWQRLEL